MTNFSVSLTKSVTLSNTWASVKLPSLSSTFVPSSIRAIGLFSLAFSMKSSVISFLGPWNRMSPEYAIQPLEVWIRKP
ncbi:MAG: hypothetical protein NWF08_07835 [Candidatus Bathyarchaeota archaeon]|nr:hypothetical protein [Candidatus Bathyarchaeota archaeon]